MVVGGGGIVVRVLVVMMVVVMRMRIVGGTHVDWTGCYGCVMPGHNEVSEDEGTEREAKKGKESFEKLRIGVIDAGVRLRLVVRAATESIGYHFRVDSRRLISRYHVDQGFDLKYSGWPVERRNRKTQNSRKDLTLQTLWRMVFARCEMQCNVAGTGTGSPSLKRVTH